MIIVVTLVTAAVIAGHLLPGLDQTGISAEIRNALHIVGFALIAAAIFESLPMHSTKAALTTLALVAVLGTLAEFVQKLGGKEIDLLDLSRDIAGATLYLCVRIVWNLSNTSGRATVVRYSMRVLSAVLGVLIFAPLGYWLAANARVAAQFPIILDFDGRWDSYLYESIESEVSVVQVDSADGKNASSTAEIQLLRRSWSGLKIEPVVSDWSSYQFLTMRAAIDGGYDSKVVVHISDGEHQGYRIQHLVGGRSVGPEATTIRFPLRGVVDIPGRPDLDPSNIRDVYIIGKTRRKGKDKSGTTRLFLDDIRLE
ncbi:MAG: hypothetical protein DRR11_08130 [Gammaproteobacteria bacterium]|nr:MAG: hypothetical protein DRR15_18375 [Gammaproteobacteria bacterium]RLA32494.1 MAG: hypothetical protein DRR11_08130 [Gammaproteobacteria bacterium]